jgi:hypothetical protein
MPEAALDIDTPGDVERLMVKPDPRVRSWQPLLVD